MSKVTNKQKIILEKVDPEMTYSMADALEIYNRLNLVNLKNLLI